MTQNRTTSFITYDSINDEARAAAARTVHRQGRWEPRLTRPVATA